MRLGAALGRRRSGFPAWHPLENALGILDRRDVAIVLFDHLHGCAHLLCQEVNVDAFRKTEGRVGMAEAIAAATIAGDAVEELCVHQEALDGAVVESARGLSLFGREDEIVQLGRIAEFLDPLKIRRNIAGGDQLAELSLAAHIDTNELAALLIRLNMDVAPFQISGLHRPHSSIGHHQNEVVDHLPRPAIFDAAFLHPFPRIGMQMAILGRRKFLAPRLACRKPAFEDLAFMDVFLIGCVAHHFAERTHLRPYGRFAHAPACAAFTVRLPPDGIVLPPILAERSDLDVAYITIELGFDMRVQNAPAMECDLSCIGPLLLKGRIFGCDLGEGFVENRQLVLLAETEIGLLLKGLFAGQFYVRSPERQSLIASLIREFYAAVPILMLNIRPPVNNEACLKLLHIFQVGHHKPPICVTSE